MSQHTIATSVAPEVVIEQVLGNLQVKGWEQPEVNVRANSDELTLEEQDDVVHLSCRADCNVRLPQGATVQVESVHGDARFKLLEDQLEIEEVHGSLTLRNVADTQVDLIHGDLSAKQVAGDLHVSQVKGNAIVRGGQGQCILEEVGGNLDLRDVEAEVRASVKGNAHLRLSMLSGESYEIQASGNVQCRIPENASLTLRLTSKAENIQVRLPDGSKTQRAENYELTLGDGDAVMTLFAGGTVQVSCQASEWDEAEDLEAEFGENIGFYSHFNQKIAEQVTSQIEAQMEAMTRQINEQMANLSTAMGKAGLSQEQTDEIMQRARESSERATARAQEKMRRAQEKLERKLEAARRRNEVKSKAADRRSQAHGKRSWSFEWGSPAPQPEKEPVSDEERLMILRMLEQKKITLQEAEELLAALED